VPRTELDPAPRVILVPGLGLFGVGKTAKDAKIAADLAETAIEVITDAEAIGKFESISEEDMFEIEYWSLEQAKLGKGSEKALARQVAVVTGGGSGIGAATAKALRAEGAEVAVLDLKIDDAMKVAQSIGGLAVECDVTDRDSVAAAFRAVSETFGGVDILVSNAGAAWQGKIGEVGDDVLRQSFELNFFGHQNVAQAAVKVMREQGTGGCLLFNTSKQAVNPGKDFGPYGLPKAATLFLSRQYALDHGADGIRSNAVNADRIRSGLLTDDMIASRSKARGLSEGDYMGGNLLKREVTAEDVANAFVSLATASSTTGAVITVDGGNIEAALR
jgi:NAD(P)-dependent dehydrogenase (short-subunit alcohol dehydrogenase family)